MGRMKKWQKHQVVKIKLNPEQTVLSCCYSVARGMVDGTEWQCVALFLCSTGLAIDTQSS